MDFYEFKSILKFTNTDNEKQKFIKENENGYYSYICKNRVPRKTLYELHRIIDNDESFYKFFNDISRPCDIKIKMINKEINKERKTISTFTGSFIIKFNKQLLTITKTWTEDTTKSIRNIMNFI